MDQEATRIIINHSNYGLIHCQYSNQHNKILGYKDNFHNFWPLMGMDPSTFSTLAEVHVTSCMDFERGAPAPKSLPICANHAVERMNWNVG
jgi:hypothetical protein